MDDSSGSLWLPILLQIFLITLNAIFASAEIAVISTNDARLEKLAENGSKKAERLISLTKTPARFFATIQVAITLSGFLGSAFAADNFSHRLVNLLVSLGVGVPPKTLNTASVIIITLILSYLTLVFGELVPKRIAMKKSEEIALGISGTLSFLSKIFAPIVSLLTFSTNAILKLFGIDPDSVDNEVSEDEIIMLVDAGSQKGVIDKDEQEYIENVFELDDTTAEEIATHRTDVAIIWAEDDIDKWEETIHNNRYTRYLLCGESEDDVLGVLDTRDYFRLSERTKEAAYDKAVYPAYFVPKTVRADVLLNIMRRDKQQLAVVLDEYGGLCGIITMLDLMGRLVGNLDDGKNTKDILCIAPDTWQIYGSALTRDVCDEIGLVLDDAEDTPSTFGGLIISELGYIPDDGSRLDIDIKNFKVYVNQVSEHRIGLTTVKRLSETKE